MMDTVCRALLTALAAGDGSALAPLRDRLEELGSVATDEAVWGAAEAMLTSYPERAVFCLTCFCLLEASGGAKPTLTDVRPLVARYKEGFARATVASRHFPSRINYDLTPLPYNVGGSLYTVLMNSNTEDGHVEHCAEKALKDNDLEGHALAQVLLRMSRTQRGKLARAF